MEVPPPLRESDLTDENIAEAMKEAPVWAKMLFSQMMNVNDEIENVRRQVDYWAEARSAEALLVEHRGKNF